MFVYVSNAASRDIHVLEFDPRHAVLRTLDIVPVPGPESASAASLPMAVSPDHRFLYATLRGEPYPVTSFAIDPERGGLTRLGMAELPDHPVYIATDRSGRFLLTASYLGSSITVSAIEDGVVRGPTLASVASELWAHSVLTDPSNRFLYAACCGAGTLMQLRFDAASGMITPNGPASILVSPHARPRHITFHPALALLYLLNEEAASIVTYAIREDGTLVERQAIGMLPAGFQGTPHTADIHLTPDGRFLYASERATSVLAEFAVDATDGTLSLIGHAATAREPRSFAIDPSGRFLLAAGLASHTLCVHAIDAASGRLTRVGEHAVGQAPNWVEIIDFGGASR